MNGATESNVTRTSVNVTYPRMILDTPRISGGTRHLSLKYEVKYTSRHQNIKYGQRC